MDFAGSVVEIFMMESKELLAKMEEALLKMEQGERSIDLINSVFRSAHTLKGAAAMFDFKELTGFAHELENILTTYRSNDVTLTSEMITSLLSGIDCLSKLLEESVQGNISVGTIEQRIQIIATLKANVQKCQQIPSEISNVPPKEPTNLVASVSDNKVATTQIASVLPNPSAATVTAPNIPTAIVYDQDPKISIIKENNTLEPQANLNINNSSEINMHSLKPDNNFEHTEGSEQISKNFIKVEAGKLDEIINLIGETVIFQAHLDNLVKNHGNIKNQVVDIIEKISHLIDTLKKLSLQLRMQPVKDIFSKFNRVVRDIASREHKQIKLEIIGGDAELDKAIIEKINDPLLHLIRNACDHGIDLPEDRIKNGKAACGVVTLSAVQENQEVVIKAADDGRGIDLSKVQEKANKMGLIPSGVELTNEEILNFIFQPGFSTAEQITELSGRGVGMDVVKKEIEKLHGSVHIDTTKMLGTTVIIRLPLTLAIIDGLLIKIKDFPCVIPNWNVVECIQITPEEYQTIIKNNHMQFRNKILPGVVLGNLLGINSNAEQNTAIIIQYGEHNIAIIVDSLEGEIKAVIKTIPEIFSDLRWINGATILGDGQVAVILDVPGLIAKVHAQHKKILQVT